MSLARTLYPSSALRPMQCSAPVSRRYSEWLDRLRSTRGIPVSDADLDRFLLSTPPTCENPNPDPSSAPPSVSDAPAATDSQPQSLGMCESVTSILSDLFDMGGAGRGPVLEIKRSSRKQLNPRYLPCYQDRIEASSLDSRWDERGKEGLEENVDVNEVEEEKEGCVGDGLEEGEEEGMSGYSRSEVTVIDTSCEVWKFEKVVYRRKDVWKVRDRKGKGKMRKTKKRKLGGSEGDGRGAKRKLVELSGVGLKLVEEDVSKDEARSSFLESSMRSRNGGSPVALTRVMPTVTFKKTKVLN